MANRAYVGNLPFTFTSADLQELFGPFGAVRGAEIVMDRMTGRSRGFGFVEMETEEALKAAMAGLDGTSVDGRNLTVNEARERAPRGPGGGSGPRPGGDRPYQGGGDRGGSFAPRGGSAPRGPGGPPRAGFGDRPAYGGGGGPPRRGGGGGRSDRPERSDRLERPEKGRDDRWRYSRGADDEE